MTREPTHDRPEAPRWSDLIAAHVAGARAASETLAAELAPPLRRAASGFLGAGDPEVEDVVGESLLAVLAYLTRRGGFSGNLVGFAVTVAVNRCRNLAAWRRRHRHEPLEPLAQWIASPDASPLDLLLEGERTSLLQEALRAVGAACERLLRAFYLDGRSIASLREELGLESVQAVYYRRAVCLQKAFAVLNGRLGGCSPAGGDGPETGGDSRA